MFERAFEDLTSGRFGDAVCGFSDVVKILPRHVQSYGNLGLAYAALGDRRRALECLEEAISIDPAYQPAIDNRRILMDQPFADRPLVGAMRQIDFYGDRARARSRQRPAPLRVVCR
jgi:tetratricopeptide (TPR) repeat protein